MILPSNDVDLQKLKDAIKEISASWTRVESERGFVNDALNRMQEEVEVPKKEIRKLAKIYHQQNLDQVKEEFDELELAYRKIMSA
jgi:archaellum component FlaC